MGLSSIQEGPAGPHWPLTPWSLHHPPPPPPLVASGANGESESKHGRSGENGGVRPKPHCGGGRQVVVVLATRGVSG